MNLNGPERTIPIRMGWIDPFTRRLVKKEDLSDVFILRWNKNNKEFLKEIEEFKKEKMNSQKTPEPEIKKSKRRKKVSTEE